MGLSPGIVTVLQEGFRPLSAQEHPPLMRSPPPSPTNPSPCQAEAIRLEVRDLLQTKGPFQKSLIQTLGFTPKTLLIVFFHEYRLDLPPSSALNVLFFLS